MYITRKVRTYEQDADAEVGALALGRGTLQLGTWDASMSSRGFYS
jgi:hypothetical protein